MTPFGKRIGVAELGALGGGGAGDGGGVGK